MKNFFRIRSDRAFDDNLNNRAWRATQLAELPGVTIDEVRAEILLDPHPDPRIGKFSLNTPYELIVDGALDAVELPTQLSGQLILFPEQEPVVSGPDEGPAA